MITRPEGPEPEAYAFRLFASTKPPTKPPSPAPSTSPLEPQPSNPTTASDQQRPYQDHDTLPRIRLDDQTLSSEQLLSTSGYEGSMLGKRKRPDTYYFAEPPDEGAKERFKAAAVEGGEVRAWSRVEWPGCRLSWRVGGAVEGRRKRPVDGVGKGVGKRMRLDLDHRKGEEVDEDQKDDEDEEAKGENGKQEGFVGDSGSSRPHAEAAQGPTKRKCRKSKATRVKIRIRLRTIEEDRREKKVALKAKKKEDKQKDAEKEAHLKEKKAKMNRKKQIKKRERKRAERGSMEGEGEGGG